MKTMIAGLALVLVLALVPAPSITVENPKLLYAAAMYKAAVGQTDSALRLMQRAEQAQSRCTRNSATIRAAGDRSTSTIL